MAGNNQESNWMDIARAQAEECLSTVDAPLDKYDSDVIEAIAQRIAGWMDTAAMSQRNADFYHGLLDQCAEHLGSVVYAADDGTVRDDPLALKIPGLVKALAKKAAE